MRESLRCYIFITIFILGVFIYYIPKIYKEYQTTQQLQENFIRLTSESEDLKEKLKQLNDQVKNFDDLYNVEKFVRNNLDMKKKDEEIYHVIYEEDKN